MTHDELRDELARAMGWVKVKDHHGAPAWRRKELIHDATSNWSHPVPEGCANAALAAFERLLPGAVWLRYHDYNDRTERATLILEASVAWQAFEVIDTGNFAHDLCALTLAAVRAKGGEADGT